MTGFDHFLFHVVQLLSISIYSDFIANGEPDGAGQEKGGV